MTNKNNKVTAFTIIELTIAMLISGIIIGITYTAYQIMSKSYVGFNNKNNDMATVITLDELLNKDFGQSDEITYTDSNVVFKDSVNLISYRFSPQHVLRFAITTDTFKIQNMGLVPTPIKSKSESRIEQEPRYIDGLGFNIVLRGDTILCQYHKTYSAQTLVKITTYAGN